MTAPSPAARGRGVLALLAALLTLASGIALAQSGTAEKPVTIYLVRHAEKQDPPSAPDSETPLTAAGQARGAQLAKLLTGCSITAAYTTPYRRTIDTAKPLVEMNKIEGSVAVPPRELASLPERIRQSGATAVLVVGHSNTVPANARALAGHADAVPPIADDAFYDLFVVTVTRWEPRETTVRHFRYGNAPPTASGIPEFTGCK